MRAKYVYESIEFKRGEDPHKALKIGKYSKPYPEVVAGDIEIRPVRGDQDTYHDESIEDEEIEGVLRYWEDHIKDENYSFWVIEEEGGDPVHYIWKDLEGMTVTFQGEYYDIPETEYSLHP